jgi:excisionase family DNA binding protein
MDSIILSQIPIDELVSRIKKAVIEEIELTKVENQKIFSKPINTKQLCEYLGVTEPTIIKWREKGKIPFFTVGSSVRFNLEKVIEALSK